MEYRPHPDVCVRPSATHGLGVYAAAAIPADTVLERCAVLQDMYMRDRQRSCAFQRYLYFAWKDHPTVGIMPSGFGSMYNDGGRCCNVVYTVDMDRRCMTFVALRDIDEDEELLIDYQAMTRPELKCEF